MCEQKGVLDGFFPGFVLLPSTDLKVVKGQGGGVLKKNKKMRGSLDRTKGGEKKNKKKGRRKKEGEGREKKKKIEIKIE